MITSDAALTSSSVGSSPFTILIYLSKLSIMTHETLFDSYLLT